MAWNLDILKRDPAKQQQRELERERDRQRRDDERQRQETAERERAFWASPAGRARAAYERGDQLLRFELDVRQAETYTIPMFKTGAITTTNDPRAVLNSIASEGWALVTGSFVFHETGSESRDKFMASGRHVAVKGTVVGYYLFRRADDVLPQTQEEPATPRLRHRWPETIE